MRFIASLIVSCFAFAGAAAATTLMEGRLVDQRTGAPIGRAEVLVVGTTISVKTDADGRFTLTPDPPVPFELLVILPGGRVAKPVRIDRLEASGVLTILVETARSEEVTVIGAAPSIDATPAAGMTMLNSVQVAARAPANLLQALETVPGVSAVSEGQAAVPAVRGLAQGRTLILIDGGRVTAERRAGPSATFLDPSVIQGVDVARGPGSVAYGSDAFGGVISVRTRRPEPNSPLRARVTGTIGAGIPDRRGALEISKGFARGAVLAQVHMRDAEDYDGPAAPVLDSGWRDRGALVRAQRQFDRGLLSVGWQGDFARDVERPRNNSHITRFFYPYENSHRWTTDFDAAEAGPLGHVKISGFFGTSDQRTDQDTFATATTARRLVRADVRANDFGVRLIAEREAGTTKIELGADVNGRMGLEALDITKTFNLAGAETGTTVVVSTKNARKIDTGLFGQVRAPMTSTFSLSAGLRGDVVRNRNTGGFFGDRADTNAAASGFGAVTIGPVRGLSVTTQVSRGFRNPRLSDLYFRGPTGRGFIEGNPNLSPETSTQLDIAVHHTAGRLRVGAYAYRYVIRNLIERFETTTDFFFFRNRGKARLTGFELEAQATLGGGVTLEFAGQVSDGLAVDDGASLDDLSPGHAGLTGRKQFGERGSVFVRIAATRALTDPGPNEVRSPGYTVVDAGASWRLAPLLELRGQARNLFNQAYRASPVTRWVFAPGRSASVTLVVGH